VGSAVADDPRHHLMIRIITLRRCRASPPSPTFAEEDGRVYMFYEAGARGRTNIAIATA
jgi:hypothetical protein